MDSTTFSIAEVELDTPVYDSAGEAIGRVDGIMSLPSSPERDAVMEGGAPDHQYFVVAEHPLIPFTTILYVPFTEVDHVQISGVAGPAGVTLRCTKKDAEHAYQHKPTG